MWETLAEKGIGSLLTPWQEKRLSEARTEIRHKEMLMLAQAEQEIELIKSGQSTVNFRPEIKLLDPPVEKNVDTGRNEPIVDFYNLAEAVSKSDFSDSIRKEKNVAKSILIAEDILSQDQQEASDQSIEDDWIYSWRESAGRVSSSELQDLWGRILAGEIKQPGSYSMRTLEFLKGLSKSEAELISKVAKFVIGDRIYRKKDQFLEKEGIYFSELLFLQDIGILSGVEAVGINTIYKSISPEKYFRPLVASNKIMLIEHDNTSKTVNAEVYLLTQVGIEVLRLASFQVENEYLNSVAQDYVKKGFKVKLADWTQETGDSGQFHNAVKVSI
jgi:hypothetical protein